jgi:hypothetical protein
MADLSAARETRHEDLGDMFKSSRCSTLSLSAEDSICRLQEEWGQVMVVPASD